MNESFGKVTQITINFRPPTSNSGQGFHFLLSSRLPKRKSLSTADRSGRDIMVRPLKQSIQSSGISLHDIYKTPGINVSFAP